MDTCIQACPCFSQCSDGCDDCANSICTCAYPDEDPNYLLCASAAETRYMACIGSCTLGDVHCLALCGVNFNTDISNCPCQVKIFKQLKLQLRDPELRDSFLKT